MSYISDVTLLDAQPEDVERINAWLREHDEERHQQITKVEGMSNAVKGGTKVYCTEVYAAALNYMPHGLIDVLRDPATWQYPCIWAVDTEGAHFYSGIVYWDGSSRSVAVKYSEAHND